MKHEFDDGSDHHDPVFDGLLRERLGSDSPPDVTSAVAMRFARGDGAGAAQRVQRAGIEPIARPFGHRVLAAALVLLGIGVVVATQWSAKQQRPNGEPSAAAPAQQPVQDPRPVDPRQPNPLGGQQDPKGADRSFALRVVDGHGGPVQDFTMSVFQATRRDPLALSTLEGFSDRAVHPRDFPADHARFDGLGAGDYVVAVTADAHVMSLSALFELRDDQPAPRITVTLNRGGELSGVVTDAAGKPLAGATVHTEADQERKIAMAGPFAEVLRARMARVHTETSTKTDDEGRYRFTKLIHGTYAVRVEHPQLRPARVGSLAIGGKPCTAGKVKLEHGTVVHGIAKVDGVAAADVKVMVIAEGDPAAPPQSWSTVSGEDGTFRFPARLPSGTYTIKAMQVDAGKNNPFNALLQLKESERSFEIAPDVDEIPIDLAIKRPK